MFNKYKDRGLTGLANCGNTCYLNSCIQILSHTYELNELLDTDNLKINNNIDSNILKEYKSLLDLMWSKNCTIAPMGFINGIQKTSLEKDYIMFSGWEQNDLLEFLNFLIDSFHNSLSKKMNFVIQGNIKNSKDKLAVKCFEMMKNRYSNDYSQIVDMFYGIQVTHIFNENNNNLINCVPEPFLTIELKIRNSENKLFENIFECFDEYTNKEYLGEDNKVEDPNNNHQKVSVYTKTMFWNLPNILIIGLKRFDNNNNKISHFVDVALDNIDLSKYVFGYNKNNYLYDCYAVCNHIGSTSGGHYTAYIKNANNKWYHFNDTNVLEINKEKVISPLTYCLFLRKKNI